MQGIWKRVDKWQRACLLMSGTDFVEEEQHNCYSKYYILFSEIIRIKGICTKLYHLVFLFLFCFVSVCEGVKWKKKRFTCKLGQPHLVKAMQDISILCMLQEEQKKKSSSIGKIFMKILLVMEEEEEKLTSILKCNWVGSEVLMMHLGTE